MTKSHNLLEMMTPEDREKALARFRQRTARQETQNKISSEIYILAEFGYYFGWQGIEAFRRNEITFEEAFALLEGARKVWYNKLLEQGRMTTTAVATPISKHGAQTYNKGMRDFAERAKL